MSQDSQEAQHSKIYFLIKERLGENPDDPVGMFAYAVYKREKMAERNRLMELYKRYPTNEEIRPFVLGAETRIDSFLKIAEVELSDFQDALVGEHLENLSGIYETQYKEAIKKFQPQKSPSWFTSAFYGFAGNILTVIIAFIFFVVGVLVTEGTPSLAKMALPFLTKWAGSAMP